MSDKPESTPEMKVETYKTIAKSKKKMEAEGNRKYSGIDISFVD